MFGRLGKVPQPVAGPIDTRPVHGLSSLFSRREAGIGGLSKPTVKRLQDFDSGGFVKGVGRIFHQASQIS
jgi:hypothetical protein